MKNEIIFWAFVVWFILFGFKLHTGPLDMYINGFITKYKLDSEDKND
jgi:hypothetical protein